LIEKIKNRSFEKALKKQMLPGRKSGHKEGFINNVKSYLILFDGTDPAIRDYFIRIQENFPPHTIKLLGFVHSDTDVEGFNMALYNKKDVRWNFTPKPSIIDLVQSQQCDMLIHINPSNYPHLHFLAVASNAIFKTSTLSRFSNDFNLEINAGDLTDADKIYQQIMTIIKNLSV